MPLEVLPYVSRALISKPPGSTAPGKDATIKSPTLKFCAPQITKRDLPSPQSSSTYLIGFLCSLSSSMARTFPTTNGPFKSEPWTMISSTSKPTRTKASAICWSEIFLGRSVSRQQNVSEETAKKIDSEVKKIVQSGYDRAKKILTEKVDDLHKVAKALLEYETLSGEEIKKIIFENIYPKRVSSKEESVSNKKLGSALGSIGLKPKTQS